MHADDIHIKQGKHYDDKDIFSTDDINPRQKKIVSNQSGQKEDKKQLTLQKYREIYTRDLFDPSSGEIKKRGAYAVTSVKKSMLLRIIIDHLNAKNMIKREEAGVVIEEKKLAQYLKSLQFDNREKRKRKSAPEDNAKILSKQLLPSSTSNNLSAPIKGIMRYKTSSITWGSASTINFTFLSFHESV